jgi:pilus assembly protein CpaE
MLGEMDAKSPVVATINDIAHVLTGRAEIKARKKAGLGSILEKLKRAK